MEIKIHDLQPSPRLIKAKSSKDDIYVQIKIKNLQKGGNNISSNGTEILKGDLSKKKYLGKVDEFLNQDLKVITSVLDVNEHSNNCPIETTFLNQKNEIIYYNDKDKDDAPLNGIVRFIGTYKIVLSILLCILCSNTVTAQTSDFNFEDLETPSSPGLILFDQSQSSIEKPTTPQGVGLSLLSLRNESSAIEFAPFWLFDHSKKEADELYKNIFSGVRTNASISIAKVSTDTASYLSIGFKTRLIQVLDKKQLGKIDDRLIAELSELNLDTAEIEKLRQEYVNALQKPIFSMDLAAAYGEVSNTNSFSDLRTSRWAVWTSLNYAPTDKSFDITGLTRFVKNESFVNYENNSELFDLGIRINREFGKFTGSVEYLRRLNLTTDNNSDYRLVGLANYEIAENIFLVSSIGKNFTDVDNIITLFGVELGLSKTKIKKS